MKTLTRVLSSFSLLLLLAFSARSQDVFKVAPVGVGTISPQQALDVAGSIKFSGALMPMPGGVANAGLVGNILLSGGIQPASPTWLANGGISGQVLTSNGSGIPVYEAAGYWNLTGNSGTTPGTNFIGTTDAKRVVFKIDGVSSGAIDLPTTAGGNGNVYLGYQVAAGNGDNGDYGTNNVALGYQAFEAPTTVTSTPTQNIFVGFRAPGAYPNGGSADYPSGSNNISFGYFGAYSITTGSGNSTITPSETNGGPNITVGNYNTAIGLLAMGSAANSNYAGNYNVAIGASNLVSGVSGTPFSSNTALGFNALYYNTTASHNTAVGDSALVHNTTGTYNTAVGHQAFWSSANNGTVTGSNNTAIGYQANISVAVSNATAIGANASAPASNSIALGNTSVAYNGITGAGLYLPGYTSINSFFYTSVNNGLVASLAPVSGEVLESNGSGQAPTWTSSPGGGGGSWSLTGNSGTTPGINFIGTTDANRLVFKIDGVSSGAIDLPTTAGGNGNVYLGYQVAAGNGDNGDFGTNNVAIGYQAFEVPSGTPSQNIFVGFRAPGAYPNGGSGDYPSGSNNISFGYFGAYSITTGSGNSTITPSETNGGPNITVGNYNTAIGLLAMGSAANSNYAGNYNVAIGASNLVSGVSGTPFSSNTALGFNALYYNTTASHNTAVGDSALVHNTTGTYNTAIGYQAFWSSANNGTVTGSNNTAIGYQANISVAVSNATAIGANATANASNLVVLGNNASVQFSSALMPAGNPGSVGNILLSKGAATAPIWLSNGTAGQVLTSQGTNAPIWANAAGSVTSVSTGAGLTESSTPITSTGTISLANGTTSGQVFVTGATPFTPALVTMSQDAKIASTGAVTIQGIRTIPVSATAPTKGNVLTYNGTQWMPSTALTNATTGQLLTFNSSSASGFQPNGYWSLSGNTGTDEAVNFVGTTNDLQLRIECYDGIGANYAGSIDPQKVGATTYGNVYMGTVNWNNGVGGAGDADAGTYSVAFGFGCLGSGAGNYNVSLGNQDNSHNSGNYNVTAGSGLFFYGTSSGVTALGNGNYNSAPGNNTTAIGSLPMQGSNSGVNNTALGYNTLAAGGSGGSNTAIGTNALYNTSSGRNTAVGDSGLVSNSSGEYNTALGYDADVSSSSLSNATIIGYQAVAQSGNSVTLGNTAVHSLYLPGYTSTGALLYTSSGTGLVADLTPGTSGYYLESNGTNVTPAWASVSPHAGTVTNVTGTAPITVAGTWLVSIEGANSNEGGLLYSQGNGLSAEFVSTGVAGDVLQSNGTSEPMWVIPSFGGVWGLTGNYGTTYTQNWIGTNDDNGFQFEVNNSEAGLIENNDGNSSGGYGNTGLGYQALTNNYSNGGMVNTAVGYNSLYNNLSGYDNSAEGFQTLISNYYGTDNTALGYQAMYNNDNDQSQGDASQNSTIGSQALINNIDGSQDDALGYYALYYNYYCSNDVALGAYASQYNDLYQDQTAFYNTAVGYGTLNNDVDGYDNTAVGANADVANWDGGEGSGAPNNMTAIGANTNVSNSNTVYVGNGCSIQFDLALAPYNQSTLIYDPGTSGEVLYTNGNYDYWGPVPVISAPTYWSLTGNSGTTPGTNYFGTTDDEPLRIYNNADSQNWPGGYAGSLDPQTGGSSNVYLGTYNWNNGVNGAGDNDAGSYNVAFGFGCLGSGGGTYNVSLGYQDNSHNSGSYNVTAGSGLFFYGSSTGLTAFGNGNYNSISGSDVTVIGSLPLQGSNTAKYNTTLGYNTFTAGGAGASNTAIGTNSLLHASGGKNTAIGDSALYSTTTGEYNTAIGYQANVSTATLSNNTAIGAHAAANQANSLVLGSINTVNGATASANIGIGTQTPAADAAVALKTGHLETQVGSSSPTIASSIPFVTASFVSANGYTDVAGQVSATAAAPPPSGTGFINVTFATTYAFAPKVVLAPANAAAATAMFNEQIYVTSTVTGFSINTQSGTAPTSTPINFNYFVIETQ